MSQCCLAILSSMDDFLDDGFEFSTTKDYFKWSLIFLKLISHMEKTIIPRKTMIFFPLKLSISVQISLKEILENTRICFPLVRRSNIKFPGKACMCLIVVTGDDWSLHYLQKKKKKRKNLFFGLDLLWQWSLAIPRWCQRIACHCSFREFYSCAIWWLSLSFTLLCI